MLQKGQVMIVFSPDAFGFGEYNEFFLKYVIYVKIVMGLF